MARTLGSGTRELWQHGRRLCQPRDDTLQSTPCIRNGHPDMLQCARPYIVSEPRLAPDSLLTYPRARQCKFAQVAAECYAHKEVPMWMRVRVNASELSEHQASQKAFRGHSGTRGWPHGTDFVHINQSLTHALNGIGPADTTRATPHRSVLLRTSMRSSAKHFLLFVRALSLNLAPLGLQPPEKHPHTIM